MNFLSIFFSVVLFLEIVSSISINCPSTNTCVIRNVLNDAEIPSNMTKVSFLSVLDSTFNKNSSQNVFFKEFDQLKIFKVHNTTFTSVDTFESLTQSVINNNQLYLKVFDLSHNIGIKVITKRTFNENFDEAIINSSEIYLFTLNLSNNQIYDVGSGAFTMFTSLETLDISHNHIQHLEGPISDNSLLNLKILRLNNNFIKNVSDKTFKGLYNLEKLFLNNNIIKTLHASNFKPLKGLRVLDVNSNSLYSLEILSPKLKTLDVAVNHLDVDRIRGLDRLTHLKSLNVSHNPIGSLKNDSFVRLISLEELNMHSLTTAKFDSDDIFLPLINLKYLDIRNNQLSEINNLKLNQLPKLILVQLDENRLAFMNVSDLPATLRYIGLQSNLFSCIFLQKMLSYLRDNNVRLYFTSNSSVNHSMTVQGIQCVLNFVGSPEECSNDYLKLYFYTWHTKISSLVCLGLAITYIYILWKNKETIRRVKDEEYEQEQLLTDEENNSSCSFNYDDLLEKEKSNELY